MRSRILLYSTMPAGGDTVVHLPSRR
eukprot:COSAG02_NODE_7212_length_3117_cov_1.444997_1_plen_25_part_10